MEDINFNTTNEIKKFTKPLIKSGQYKFKISDIKSSIDKSKNFFILDIIGQKFENNQVSLVWAAPVNDEYSPGTNVGKLFQSVGIEMGNSIKASSIIGLVGNCLVNDYTKQESGKVITFSVIGDLIIPEIKVAESSEVDTKEAGINEDSTM